MPVPIRVLRPDVILPFGLLAAGSLAFIGGGRHHPIISAATLGPMGSEQFYRAFAHEMIHTPGWQQFHMLILVGPILWALGAAGVARLLPVRVGVLAEVGRAALLLAAASWTFAFILDGFVGPRYAQILATGGPNATGVLTAFAVTQLTVARVGMISVALMGAGITAYSLALLAGDRSAVWPRIVGGLGIGVGLWPLFAAASGEFDPGPFTSPYWTMTAIALATWMLLFGTALVRHEGKFGARSNEAEDPEHARLAPSAAGQ